MISPDGNPLDLSKGPVQIGQTIYEYGEDVSEERLAKAQKLARKGKATKR